MANVDCYLCLAAASSAATINTFQSNIGDPIGCCFRCGVLACGHHALRNTSPIGFECVVCVPSHIAPPAGPGGGPTTPQGGGPGRGPAPVATYGLEPYTEEEFAVSYPTSHNILREKVRDAIRHPETTMKEYFGEDYVERIADAFGIKGAMSPSQKTRIAAALAVIIFAEIPDQLLAPHLQRYPMQAQQMEVS